MLFNLKNSLANVTMYLIKLGHNNELHFGMFVPEQRTYPNDAFVKKKKNKKLYSTAIPTVHTTYSTGRPTAGLINSTGGGMCDDTFANCNIFEKIKSC